MKNDRLENAPAPASLFPTPIAIGSMTRAQLDAELQKGVDSMNSRERFTQDEAAEILAKEFDSTANRIRIAESLFGVLPQNETYEEVRGKCMDDM